MFQPSKKICDAIEARCDDLAAMGDVKGIHALANALGRKMLSSGVAKSGPLRDLRDSARCRANGCVLRLSGSIDPASKCEARADWLMNRARAASLGKGAS